MIDTQYAEQAWYYNVYPHTDSSDINAMRQVVVEDIKYAEEEKKQFSNWLKHMIAYC